jgi:hypothetical protein
MNFEQHGLISDQKCNPGENWSKRAAAKWCDKRNTYESSFLQEVDDLILVGSAAIQDGFQLRENTTKESHNGTQRKPRYPTLQLL